MAPATDATNHHVAAHTVVTAPPMPSTVTAPPVPFTGTTAVLATTAENCHTTHVVTAHTTRAAPLVPPTAATTAIAPTETANFEALTIGTTNNGAGESFHLQAPPPTTGATSASARPGVTFGATPNTSDINTRMMEIANSGLPATTTTNRPDRQRQWSFNRGFVETRSCHGCGEQGHLIKNCPNKPYCNHCKTFTHSTEQCRFKTTTWTQGQPLASTPAESPGAGGYHPVQSPAGAYTGTGFPAASQIPNVSPANTSTQDIVLQAFMTKLEENNVQSERTEDRRRMLDITCLTRHLLR